MIDVCEECRYLKGDESEICVKEPDPRNWIHRRANDPACIFFSNWMKGCFSCRFQSVFAYKPLGDEVIHFCGHGLHSWEWPTNLNEFKKRLVNEEGAPAGTCCFWECG